MSQDESLKFMTYTLNSGIKETIALSEEQIGIWIHCYKNNQKFITNIGKEQFGLDPDLVADFKVNNRFSYHFTPTVPIQSEKESYSKLAEAYKEKQIPIKISSERAYHTESPYKRTKWHCTHN